MNKKTVLSIFILVAVLFSVFVFIYHSRSENIKWGTYSDKTLGISFNYPIKPDHEYSPYDEGGGVVIDLGDDILFSIGSTYNKRGEKDMTIQDIVNMYKSDSNNYLDVIVEDIKIGGYPAIRVKYKNRSTYNTPPKYDTTSSFTDIYAYIDYKNPDKFVHFSGNEFRDPGFLKLNKILSTFKFNNQK
ncbi:MAG: hypothetical protein ABL899_00365 [Nitrospira sp.]